MGLIHPVDLASWQAWQNRQHRMIAAARRLRAARQPAPPSRWVATAPTEDGRPDALFVLDSANATSRHAVLAPAMLRGARSAVVASVDPTTMVPDTWSVRALTASALEQILDQCRAVVSMAHYLPLGAEIWAAAKDRDLPWATVQHGLLTPYSPPAPDHGTLLTWSDEDATYWLSGRDDIGTVTVGSQLLHQASLRPAPHVSRFLRPVFLGQLHGAELPRSTLARAARSFCSATGARYRPHPAEVDRLSRWQHRWWQRGGIEIDRAGVDLSRLDEPTVSVFSTGVLEAAARGIPAWVWCPDPPPWLTEFWRRYRMHPWGGQPTPAPTVGDRAPAEAVVDWVDEHVERGRR
ncbi:MAG: hypothetical protein ACK5LS_01985 [Propioniciclava sp.]